MAAGLEAWMTQDLDRLRKYQALVQTGVSDLNNNDFIRAAADRMGGSSYAEGKLARGRESRQLSRYGVSDMDPLMKASTESRTQARGLADTLSDVNVRNQGMGRQYDADEVWRNTLIGVGHGVGSASKGLADARMTAEKQREDAYDAAKQQEKSAAAAKKQQYTQMAMSTLLSFGMAVM